ncbi:MAG: gas vesicle protein [Myxococcota bacterium]|nr:gas vesicle protein [Myxococcota bacterium]
MRQQAVVHNIGTDSLADILERVLDKGIVIVGDVKVNIGDVELLTIKIRLLVCSVEKARELGIDWARFTRPTCAKRRPHTRMPVAPPTGSARRMARTACCPPMPPRWVRPIRRRWGCPAARCPVCSCSWTGRRLASTPNPRPRARCRWMRIHEHGARD